MGMFGISLSEFFIIAVLAVIVIGPDRLPEVARTVGKFVWELRRSWDDVRETVRKEMNALQAPLEEARQTGRQTTAMLREEATKFNEAAQQTIRETKSQLQSTTETTSTKKSAGRGQAAPVVAAPSPAARAPATAVGEEPAGAQPFSPPEPTVLQATYFDLDGNVVTPRSFAEHP